MKEIFDAIAQVGFPIVVALLLLIRIESKMEKLNETINRLGEKVDSNTSATLRLTTVIDERLKKRR